MRQPIPDHVSRRANHSRFDHHKHPCHDNRDDHAENAVSAERGLGLLHPERSRPWGLRGPGPGSVPSGPDQRQWWNVLRLHQAEWLRDSPGTPVPGAGTSGAGCAEMLERRKPEPGVRVPVRRVAATRGLFGCWPMRPDGHRDWGSASPD